MSAWPPSELVKLKDLVGQGLSAGLIASLLNRQFGNGRSRSAVLGKIHRGHGQFGRLAQQPGFRLDGEPRAKSGPKAGSVKASVAGSGLEVALPKPVGILTGSLACKSFSVPATRPVRFIDALFADRCLHFVGDPYSASGPDMPVCGAERAEGVLGTRYCRRHLASQHQARDAA